MTPVLRFHTVAARFGDHTLFRHLDMTLERGDIVAVVGPSGVGKSTLLRLAAGLLDPSEGRVETDPALRVAMAFQAPRLLPWKRAWDNIALPLRCQGIDRVAAEDTARRLLDQFGLTDAAEQWPGALSGGMAQRVSLARALAGEPDLLLLDEPTTGIDDRNKAVALGVLARHLTATKAACLCATHTPEDILPLANRLLRLAPEGIVLSERDDSWGAALIPSRKDGPP